MTTLLKQEPSPDSVATNYLQNAGAALDHADDVSDVVQNGLDIVAAVLKVASAVPLLGPVCMVAKYILEDVRKCADKVDDVLEAGRRVYDTLRTIEVMARYLARLEEQERADLKQLMEEVRAALVEMKELVETFGQRGWFKRLLQLSKHDKTFRKLDRKIRDKMEMAMRLYRFSQDAATAKTHQQLETFLGERIYALEEALAAKVKQCIDEGTANTSDEALEGIEQDADALDELARTAGISAAEMSVEMQEFCDEVREEFEQLQSGMNSLVSSLHEIKQLITASATHPRHSSGSSGDRCKLTQLTADDVVLMVHGLELGKYADTLHALPMTGAGLAEADDNDLREAGITTALHRKLLLSKVAHFFANGVPPYLLQSKENHAAVKIQATKRGNSARLRLVQSMPALSHWGAEPLADRYRSLRLDRYKAQSFFHHIDTSWPGLQLVNEEPYIFVCHKFITQSECDQLISSFSKSTKQGSSITYAAQEGKRTSTTLLASEKEVTWLRLRIAALTKTSIDQLQQTKLTRYGKGEFFCQHMDTTKRDQKEQWCRRLCESNEGAEQLTGTGEPCFDSDRFCTVFIYLNDVPEGGRTRWLQLNSSNILHERWLPQMGKDYPLYPLSLSQS
jgi:hypothetical protein